MNAILISGTWLKSLGSGLPYYHAREVDPDMSFSSWMRENVSLCNSYTGSVPSCTYCI